MHISTVSILKVFKIFQNINFLSILVVFFFKILMFIVIYNLLRFFPSSWNLASLASSQRINAAFLSDSVVSFIKKAMWENKKEQKVTCLATWTYIVKYTLLFWTFIRSNLELRATLSFFLKIWTAEKQSL